MYSVSGIKKEDDWKHVMVLASVPLFARMITTDKAMKIYNKQLNLLNHAITSSLENKEVFW